VFSHRILWAVSCYTAVTRKKAIILEEISQMESELLAYTELAAAAPARPWHASLWQVMRFGIVGGLNTMIDILVFNIILFCLPTQVPALLVLYNACAYTLGALNSFLLNKYWTFQHTKAIKRKEVMYFMLVTTFGILCNSALVALISSSISHSMLRNTFIWANTAKVLAILGTSTLSYLGMRLWVFADPFQMQQITASDKVNTQASEEIRREQECAD
jgi:putative flippase GtrA